jgi:hypothetical protein
VTLADTWRDDKETARRAATVGSAQCAAATPSRNELSGAAGRPSRSPRVGLVAENWPRGTCRASSWPAPRARRARQARRRSGLRQVPLGGGVFGHRREERSCRRRAAARLGSRRRRSRSQDWPSRSARGDDDDDASGVARRRLRVRGRRDSLGRSSCLVRDALDPGDSTVAAWRGRRIIPTRPTGWRRSLSSCSPPLPLLTDRQPSRTAGAPGQWAMSRPSKAIPRRSEGPPTLGYGGRPMCGPGP